MELEALLSRGGRNSCYHTNVWGALLSQITSKAPHTSLLVIATYITSILHFTSVKVTWTLLDELKLSSSINSVARLKFANVIKHLRNLFSSLAVLKFARCSFALWKPKPELKKFINFDYACIPITKTMLLLSKLIYHILYFYLMVFRQLQCSHTIALKITYSYKNVCKRRMTYKLLYSDCLRVLVSSS